MSMSSYPANDSRDEGEIYSPAMEEGGFDARESTGRRALLLLAGTFAFLLLVAVVLLKVYAPGTRGGAEPPRILADTSPYKSAPENPGGTQTPNQDIAVYDRLSSGSTDETVNIVPDSENPVAVEPAPTQATVIVKKPEVTAPSVAPVAVAPAPQAPAVKPQAAQISKYVVQVASLRSSTDANVAWDKLNKSVGDLIPASLFADIKRADLEGKGVFFRLRVAGFADKTAATAFCDRLKARSQNCIVVTR